MNHQLHRNQEKILVKIERFSAIFLIDVVVMIIGIW